MGLCTNFIFLQNHLYRDWTRQSLMSLKTLKFYIPKLHHVPVWLNLYAVFIIFQPKWLLTYFPYYFIMVPSLSFQWISRKPRVTCVASFSKSTRVFEIFLALLSMLIRTSSCEFRNPQGLWGSLWVKNQATHE